jgi:DNA helicase MCM8
MIVGDPGLGKSQMLRACNNVAPLGVYVCANTTSSAGLTVSLTREAGTGELALEAGALVLADEGCCCIDEFDKIEDPHSLLEAMEQQSVSIAKAGVIANLPARASILSAANPKLGHYE